jgi:hypothetical protein
MKKKVKYIEYNPIIEPARAHNYNNVRWVENVSCGLRLVDFADKIAHLNHEGWFIDDDFQDETYRGVVYQLPARDGKAQYVYGYADPCNDDCALLCFDVTDDKLEAANSADNFAESFAEEARDYSRASNAGRRYEELADEIKDMRKDALAIGEEMRAARKTKLKAPTICATLRNEIMALYRRIQKARKERKELMNDFGWHEGFTQ